LMSVRQKCVSAQCACTEAQAGCVGDPGTSSAEASNHNNTWRPCALHVVRTRQVYAVEATDMAKNARKLVEHNKVGVGVRGPACRACQHASGGVCAPCPRCAVLTDSHCPARIAGLAHLDAHAHTRARAAG
jgi:hypothetical protein